MKHFFLAWLVSESQAICFPSASSVYYAKLVKQGSVTYYSLYFLGYHGYIRFSLYYTITKNVSDMNKEYV